MNTEDAIPNSTDAEVSSLTRFVFFEQKSLRAPSPVKILICSDEWIKKVIQCGIEAFRALLNKKEIDKIVVSVGRVIDPIEFTNIQVRFSHLQQKFKSEFVAFHQEHDPDFVSEVRTGNIAKGLLRTRDADANLDDFTRRLEKYFQEREFSTPERYQAPYP